MPPASDLVLPEANLVLPALPSAPQLIGRSGELADLAQRLCATPQRLVTLVGPGGIGKTSLALAVAAAIAARPDPSFPDGIAVTLLAVVRQPADVAPTIARALGLPPQSSRPVLDQLAAALRHRTLLLILDNLEHLLTRDATSSATALVDLLLQSAPGLRILATSRERLQLHAEWVVVLDGLEAPAADHETEQAQPAAVQLFLERARQVTPGFALRPEEVPLVTHLCRTVAGSPLAIELAAGWTRALTLAEIAQELEQGFDFLARRDRDRPERHHSMRAVLDHSWQLLDAAERLALARIAVFHGGCDRSAATRITGTSLPTLAVLIDKSLLNRVELDGSTRYAVHELVRHYAAERLAEDPADQQATADRHSVYYAELVQQTINAQTGGSSHAGWSHLTRNSENLRAAWMHAATSGDPGLVLAMARGLMIFYDVRGWVREGAALFEAAAAALRARAPVPTGALGVTLGHHGYFLIKAGQSDSAVPLLLEAATLLEATGAHAEQAHVRIHLGSVEQYAGRFAAAHLHYHEAGRLAAMAGDHFTQQWAIYFQGALALATGDYAAAEQYFVACLTVWREQGYSRGVTSALNLLAETLRWSGTAAPEPYLQESLEIARSTQDTQAMSSCLRELGALALARGDVATAQRLLTESCLLARELAAPRFYGRSRLLLVQVELQRGDGAAARQGCSELVRDVGPRVPLLLPAIAYTTACLLTSEGRDQDALALLIAVEAMPSEYASHQLAARLRVTLERRCSAAQRDAAAAVRRPALLSWLADLLAPTPAVPRLIMPQPPSARVGGGVFIPATGETLSPREVDVLRLLIAGANNPAIARQLFLSPFTVKNHVARILEKLDVATRTMAALRGRELGLTAAPLAHPSE